MHGGNDIDCAASAALIQGGDGHFSKLPKIICERGDIQFLLDPCARAREREREREREGEGQRDGEKGGEPRELFSEVVPGDIEKWHFPPGGVHPAGSSYEYTNVYQRNVDRIARARI